VAFYLEPNVYTLVVQTQTNDGELHWRNSIDIQDLTLIGPPGPGTTIVQAGFESFLQGVQRDDCSLVRAFLRPWVRGSGAAGHEVAIWDVPLALPCKNWGAGNCFFGSANDGTSLLQEAVVRMIKPRAIGGGRKHFMSLRDVIWAEIAQLSPQRAPEVLPANLALVTADLNTWAANHIGIYSHGGLATPYRFVLVDASIKHAIPPTIAPMLDPVFVGLGLRDVTNASRR